MNAGKTGTPAFDVWFTPVGREDYNDLRADLRREVDSAVAALERRGCAAAHYRLAGANSDVGRICAGQRHRRGSGWTVPGPGGICLCAQGIVRGGCEAPRESKGP